MVNKFVGIKLLHAHVQRGCIVFSVKALVQDDFHVHALAGHQQTLVRKIVQNSVNLSKRIFMASNVFMQMFNVSTL